MLTDEELLQLVRSTTFEACDSDKSHTVGKAELQQALGRSCQEAVGRPLSDAECQRLLSMIDHDSDGQINLDDWRRVGGTSEADTVAGLSRAVLQTLLRIAPRTPAMRFFKPKDYRLQTPSGKADGAASTLAARLLGGGAS